MKVSEILEDRSIWLPNERYEREHPKVSVLLPTFRRAESGYLERAIDSVLDQTFKDLELIVIDDCSGDGSFDIIKQYMRHDSRVNCIRHQSNVGLPAISEYEGYRKARGTYIAFLFDDNEWQLDALDKTIEYMEKGRIKACYGSSRLYYGEESEYLELGGALQVNISDLKCDNFIANGSVVLHREVIETVGLYDPHLSLTRLCDWDLWRRIAARFDFCPTGIYFTNEHGAKLKDSLGNSFKMDTWAAEERMRYHRDQVLLPAVFEDVDIYDTFGARSEFFLECMAEYIKQYRGKQWFREDDPLWEEIRCKKNVDRGCKRIVVMIETLTASETLYFDRVFQNAEHVVKFCIAGRLPLSHLALVDAAVLARNLHCNQKLKAILTRSGVDCYYFVDDNYIELAKEYPENAEIQFLAALTTRKELKRYRGILLPSKALRDYFEKEHLHHELILVEPNIDVHNIHEPPKKKRDGRVTVAFMGGAFRNETLERYVLPALKLLSRKVCIDLYCPGSDQDDLEKEQTDRLRISTIPRDLSLDRTIARFASKEVDIQIHCGPDIRNNRYKTKNALINAVQLGACLVTSECAPYTDRDGDDGCYLMAKDDVQSWCEALYKPVMDAQFRRALYRRAKEHCLERYDGRATVRAFEEVLSRQVQERPYYQVNKRYELLFFEVLEENRRNMAGLSIGSGGGPGKPSRVAESDKLCASKRLEGKRSYSIVCDCRDLSDLGIIFTSEGTVSGRVVMEVSSKGYVLRRAEVQMQQIVYNQWTYFPIDTLYGCGGKTLEVSLSFEYAELSDKLLVYEDIRNRSFLYRLVNKLGLDMKVGTNVLYTDCRG